MYPGLVRGAMEQFSSPEVMRFLGRRVHGNFSGEVLSDVSRRPAYSDEKSQLFRE
jgi:hypothetical protein